MKKSLIWISCGLLLGAAAAWAVIQFVIPRWNRSAVDNTYWQVTSRLDAGGEAFAYLHAEQVAQALQAVLTSLKANIDAMPAASQPQARQGLGMLDAMWKGYGLDEISGLGFSSFAVKPGLHRVRFVLHHRPGRDKGLIWNITGPAPRPLDEVKLLPANAALAFVSDYNIVKLGEWLTRLGPAMAGQQGKGPTPDQSLALIKGGMQAAGVDYDRLVKCYGNRLGFLVTLDPEKRVSLPLAAKPLSIPEPAFALLVRVNDNYLFDTLKAKLTATGHNKAVEADGVKKIVFPRLPAPFPLEPVIAQKGEWLLAASRSSLLEDVFSPKAKRLADSDAFKQMAYKLPRRGNGFGYVSPLLPRLVAQVLRENTVAFPAPAAMEKVIAFIEQGKGFCQVWENSGQGLVYTINHGFEISSLPGLIDAFVQIAREKSKALAAAAPEPPAGQAPGK